MAEVKKPSRPKPVLELVDFRGENRGIITYCELLEGEILPVGLEILGEATRMCEKLGESGNVSALIIGSKIPEEVSQNLISYGAKKVIVVDQPDFEIYNTRVYASTIVEMVKKYKPEIFLFGATTIGRGLAPRVAARLEVGLSADCTEFDIGEYENRPRRQRFEKVAHFIRPSFAEAKLATIIGPWTFPQMATARPGAMVPLEDDSSRKGEVIFETVTINEEDTQVKVLEIVRGSDDDQGETVDFKSAEIIVAGGFGVGKDGFDLLKELVDAINKNGQKAELGASRKAVDSGYIPYKHQIGQTGKTTESKLYIAVGISGAIQHIAGMKRSKKVIAINRDSSAPIFSHADYGIVGNYEDAIPELIKKVKNGHKFPL
ncbi:MAG: electron transfer flavoprotein subunit alpha/FixB family protein [Candidatus Hodarchaeales archaeon]|jgi:electron transfer flavoprotein alpha subunit